MLSMGIFRKEYQDHDSHGYIIRRFKANSFTAQTDRRVRSGNMRNYGMGNRNASPDSRAHDGLSFYKGSIHQFKIIKGISLMYKFQKLPDCPAALRGAELKTNKVWSYYGGK